MADVQHNFHASTNQHVCDAFLKQNMFAVMSMELLDANRLHRTRHLELRRLNASRNAHGLILYFCALLLS